MSDDRVPGPGQPAARLEATLLEARLSVPRRRPGSVSRAGLIEAARTGPARVVGITAPAGYGKSTLLAQWAEAEDRRVGWVSLDRLDDDPSTLLTLLASAYGQISGQADLACRRDRARGVGPGSGGAPRRHRVPHQSRPVRPVPRRPARAPVAGLSRCPERGGRGHPGRLPAGGRESLRAAAPAPVAGLGRRRGAGGQ